MGNHSETSHETTTIRIPRTAPSFAPIRTCRRFHQATTRQAWLIWLICSWKKTQMDDTKIWCRIVKDSEGVQLRSTGVFFFPKRDTSSGWFHSAGFRGCSSFSSLDPDESRDPGRGWLGVCAGLSRNCTEDLFHGCSTDSCKDSEGVMLGCCWEN